MASRRSELAARLAAALVSICLSAGAETPSAQDGAAQADALEPARALYLEGLSQVRQAHWGEALAAFERSQALHPHPLTTYNIGACERALGHYTRARRELLKALESSAFGELPPTTQTDARAFLEEISQLLVRLSVTVEPAAARITVDGRPLESAMDGEGAPVLIAGTLPPGRGGPATSGHFQLLADPGVHVITLSRPGYGDIVVNKTYRPGQSATERWVLSELPATIRVSSNEARALVSVNGRDVGVAPVDVLRPAGSYRVEVTKPGFVPYLADVRVNAGQESSLRAALVPERQSLLGKWWFWTAAVAVAGGVATATYFVARGESSPQRPALDGGTLGWTARIP